MVLSGKTALVTGGARRVGKAIALQLAASGADVIVHYNSSSRESDAVAAEILTMGRQSHTIYGDLGSVDAIRRMAAELDRHSINIDILVNSAAVYFPTALADVDEAQWDHILNVNLKAPFFLSQIFGLKMKARGFGRIVNIADCNTRRVYRNFTPYLASKAGLATLTEALALELSPEVTVNAVAPGTVLPPDNASDAFHQQAINRSPLKKAGTPEDIALMVDYLVTRGDFMTGTVVTVDGGATIR